MLTGLALITDKREYSRFETRRSVVKVRILPVPETELNTDVLLVLRKKGGPVIASQTHDLNGDLPKGKVAEFDLNTPSENGIPLCTRGQYVIEGYSPAAGFENPDTPGLVTASVDFRVSMITVAEMRKGYCFGVPLYATDMPMPKRQPTAVTGVEIERLSENTARGIHALVFNAQENTLSWGGGPAIPITGPQEILPDAFGDYAEVNIDEFSLPDESAEEGIVVDKGDISDEFIQGEIDKAIAEVENELLKINVEPLRIATEPYFSNPPEGAHYDKKAPAVMFTRRDFNRNAMAWKLDLPVQQLQRVDILEGYLGNTKSLTIHNGALSVQKKSGSVTVLPYDSQYSYLYTFFVQLRFWGVREYVADFWRYTAIAGLSETSPDVLKLIGYVAAISILTVGGQGYRGGFSSESDSKDGVSRSVSYTASASYGIYSATIVEYKDWIKRMAPKLRNNYRGIPTVVL